MNNECDGKMYTSVEPVKCWCGDGEGCEARNNISNSKPFTGRHEMVWCGDYWYCVHCAQLRVWSENNETVPGPPRPFIKLGNYAKYWWFRIAGYGLHFRWTHDGYTPLFSERNGHEKVMKLGRLWIKVLRP